MFCLVDPEWKKSPSDDRWLTHKLDEWIYSNGEEQGFVFVVFENYMNLDLPSA